MTAKSKDRIPFETLDESAVVSAWALPTVEQNSRLFRSAKRDGDKKKPQPNEKIETVKKNKKAKPLTVEELREITETARREGFEQGLKEGTEQGIREGTKVGEKTGQQRAYLEAKKEIEALQNQLRQVITRLHEPMEKQDAAIENTLVDLALNLTKRVIASEVQSEPKHLLNMVKHVLADIPKGTKNIRVSVCPSDADLIDNLIPADQREWQIRRDEALASGGCVVETEVSLIDYSVDNRLHSYLEKTAHMPHENLDPLPDYQQETTSQEALDDDRPSPKKTAIQSDKPLQCDD